jgi:hypothetical protein
MGAHDFFFLNDGYTVWFPSLKCLTCGPTKMNKNMLLNFPRCLSILLLQTSKTNNNALDIDAIYNLKLRKTTKFPWPPICPWCKETIDFINVIGESGDSKSKKFLFERISLAIQRGNAASIRGTFPDSALLSEIFAL